MRVVLLHLLIWYFLSCLDISHINPQIVIKKYMLGSFVILINPKDFSNVSLSFFSYCRPNVILYDSTRITKPVHHLNILVNSIINHLNFFVFYEGSEMIKQLFLCLDLHSIKRICNEYQLFSKSKIHSLFLNFQIRSFCFVKHYFMSSVFTIKRRMISFTKLIKLFSNNWYLSTHRSKDYLKSSFLFLKP